MLYTYMHNSIVSPNPIPVHSCSREMGLTRAEFDRTLPRAVKGEIHAVHDHGGRSTMTVVDGPRRASIQYRVLSNRKVGSLSLPRLRVDIDLSGFTRGQAQGFTEHFDRSFLRMGGG